ncbi:hypothetical protein UYO_0747 [Lachnospiraceae bacterium JC7]|nr:hypothetical protein UYO_0747 [Lachnospiraceae bacterium JC7]
MFCTNCGADLGKAAKFCSKCGAATGFGAAMAQELNNQGSDQIQGNASVQNPNSNIKVGYGGDQFQNSVRNQHLMEEAETELFEDSGLPEGIYRDAHGTLYWEYQLDMLKNPVILFMILKIMFAICGGIALFLMILMLINDEDFIDALKMGAIIVFGMGGFIAVLTLISWFIVVAIHGAQYIVVHRMNENEVLHMQTRQEKNVSRKMRGALLIVGLLSRNPSSVGLAMGAREEMTSSFRDVKAVIASRGHDLIKVNNVLLHNHVYAYPHQYEFVFNYIASHCPGAKVKG